MLKRKNKIGLSLLLIVFIVVVIILIALFLNRGKHSDSSINYKQKIEDYRTQTIAEGFQKIEQDITISAGDNQLTYHYLSGNFEIHTPNGIYQSALREESDPDQAKLLQSSLLYIQYFDKDNVKQTMSSLKDSLKNKGVELYIKDNTFRILYTMGKDERTYFLPLAIRSDTFENNILPKLNDTQARKLKKYYRKYTVDETLTATEKSELLAKYPGYKKNDIYVYIGGDSIKLQSSFEPIFQAAGFNESLYADELKALNASEEGQKTPAIFFVPVEFSLDSSKLTARVINEGIAVSDDSLYLTDISLLPCFGNSGTSSGYMILPDGGGAYVDLSSPDISGENFTKQIYGDDLALQTIETDDEEAASIKSEEAYIPSYIFSSGQIGYAATATSGAEYAKVNAGVKGKSNAVNYAYFSFSYRQYQIVETGKTDQMSTVIVYAQDHVTKDFEVSYLLAPNNPAQPEKMMSLLKNFYQEQGYLPGNLDINSSETLFIDIYCQIVNPKTGKHIGLSTFEQIEMLLEQLHNQGVKKCFLNLKGISDDGLLYSYDCQLKVSNKLGGTKQLVALSKKAESLGYEINLSWNIGNVSSNRLLDGFFSMTDAAKNVEQLVIKNRKAYLLSPGKYDKAAFFAAKQLAKLSDANVGLTIENNGLYSNFNKKSEFLRENTIEKFLKVQNDIGQNTKVTASAPYLFAISDCITDVVLNSSQTSIQTESFPMLAYLFNQSVLYSGESYNLADDPVAQYENTIVSGAALKVSWMMAADTAIIDAGYNNEFYSLYYKDSFDEVIRLYQEYNAMDNAGEVRFSKTAIEKE